MAKEMRNSCLKLLDGGSSLGFPYAIIVNKLLREVIDDTFDSAAYAFVAARFPRFELAAYLVAFALRTCNPLCLSIYPLSLGPKRLFRLVSP